jgi:hypothetical protein
MHQSTGRFRHKLPCGVSGCTEFHSESCCVFLLMYSSYVAFTSVIALCKHFLCSFVAWHTCAHHDVLVLKAYDLLPNKTDTTAYHMLKCSSHRPKPPSLCNSNVCDSSLLPGLAPNATIMDGNTQAETFSPVQQRDIFPTDGNQVMKRDRVHKRSASCTVDEETAPTYIE